MQLNTLNKVQKELETSNKAYGQFTSYAEGIAVLREEYLELEQEIFKKPSKRDKKRIHDEAIQVAAMALKIIEYTGDR